jgi:hypothetical protein
LGGGGGVEHPQIPPRYATGYHGYDSTFLCVILEISLIGFCGHHVLGNGM